MPPSVRPPHVTAHSSHLRAAYLKSFPLPGRLPAALPPCLRAGCAVVAMVVPSIWKPLKLLGGTAGGLS
jgi:hypothetical protein